MYDLFFSSLLTLMEPATLALVFAVALMGLIFGALPGLNATMAVAILLPMTFLFQPSIGLALLVTAYISGISGGLVSAALLRIPGTPSSIATTFDAFPLARKGQAVKALGTGMIASFLGGMVSLALLVSMAPVIARIAIKFGPFEYAALAALALTMVGVLSSGSMVKGLLAGCLGLAASTIGFSPIDGTQRFVFGNVQMMAGLGILPFLVGLFAIPQLMREAMSPPRKIELDLDLKGFGVTFAEFKANIVNFIRSSLIGTGIGVLPGIGGSASNLVAYAAARQASRRPEKFGTGVVEGIWASESANNASVGGALLPLLTLGIPGDGVTAMLIGGFEIHGLQPGPMLFRTTPDVIAAIYASFCFTALIVVVLQLSTIRIFPRVLLTPKHYLVPMLILLTAVGAFSADHRYFDLWVMLGVGIVGFFLEKYKFPLAPMVLGFVMGPILEENLRRALIYSKGDLTPFLTKPIAAAFVVCAVLSLAYGVWQNVQRKKSMSKARKGAG